ncbi:MULTISPECIES: hypothetical protein [Streptomyces]|uniref:hypothetical protein n=1 Tax=Streptomyces TaxID=1883 RepID=UPI00287F4E6F|nr:hypothetical protein [Streptomyces sp. CGMCC 4.1456]WNF62202.1 hypothetical protein RJD14_06175 [Streptomyces sp. CGMCC 4.1456]
MRRRRFISGLVGAGAGLGLASAGPAAASVRDSGAPREWGAVTAPQATGAAQLIDVAASGPSLAWAVGEEGRSGSVRGTALALLWDGTSWRRTGPGFGGHLGSVAATPDGSAWAVGTDTAGTARLLAWNGTAWQEAGFPGRGAAGTSLTGVATGPSGQVWVSGRNSDGSVLLHGDNGRWTWLPAPPATTTVAPTGVHRAPCGDLYVYGHELVARWDGGAWTVLPAPGGIRASFTGLLPVAPDDIWLTGYDYGVGGPPGKPPGVRLLHGDGNGWESVTAPFGVGMLTGIVGDARGRPDRIAGWDFWDQTRAHYLRWDGTAWVSERGPVATTPVVMNAIASVPGSGGSGGYWAVGTTSTSPSSSALPRIER